jgi:hypothetical protein
VKEKEIEKEEPAQVEQYHISGRNGFMSPAYMSIRIDSAAKRCGFGLAYLPIDHRRMRRRSGLKRVQLSIFLPEMSYLHI